jgi:hypothetical protein
MTFYYSIFLVLFAFYILSAEESQKKLLYVFSALLLIIIAGFRSIHTDRDYATYVSYIQKIDQLQLVQLEPTFFLITRIGYTLGNPIMVPFVIYAILGVGLKFKAIAELTEFWFLSVIIYFSYYFFLHEMTEIRVGVSSAILLLSIKDIYNRNLLPFVLKMVLGILFHYSFLVFGAFYLLNPRRLKPVFFYLIITLAYLLYFSGFDSLMLIRLIPLPFIQMKIDAYRSLMAAGNHLAINVLNVLLIYRLIFMGILLWKHKLLESFNKYSTLLIKIYSWSLFFLVFLASMPVLAFRVNQLLCVVEIILWPFILYLVKEKHLAVILVVLTALGFITMELFYNQLVAPYF